MNSGHDSELEEMPDFKPLPLPSLPGVDRPQVDAKTQGILDAFNVMAQQINYLAKRDIKSQRFSITMKEVIDGLNKTIDGLNKTIVGLEKALQDIQETPQKLLWKAVKWGGSIALASYITWFVTTHAGK